MHLHLRTPLRSLNPWRGLGGLPAEVWIISVTTLVNRMGTMVLPFLVLYCTQHLGFSARVGGLALAVYGIGGLISAPIGGRLCDRVGATRVMEASLLLSGVLLLLFPLARSLEAVLALTFAWALVGEAIRPASLAALTADLSPERRKAAIALNRLAINLGMSVGPAVGGFLAMASFPLLFLADGATCLVAGAALALMLRRARREAAPPPPVPVASAGRAAPVGVLRDRRVFGVLLASFVVGLVFFQHESAMSLFLVRDLHRSESFYGMLFLVNTLLIIFLEVPLNLAMAHWSHRRALVLSSVLVGAGFGALAFSTGTLAVVLTVVVWTFGEMIFFPVSATAVADAAPAARRGEYMGAYSMTFGLAFTVGPWAGMEVMERFGAPVLWSATLLCGLVAAGLVAATLQPEPQPAAAVVAG